MSTKYCPCGGATEVIDSREGSKGTIRRRRKCSVCKERFTTVEIPIEEHKALHRGIKALNKIKLLTRGVLGIGL